MATKTEFTKALAIKMAEGDGYGANDTLVPLYGPPLVVAGGYAVPPRPPCPVYEFYMPHARAAADALEALNHVIFDQEPA